ncbi:ribulose-phosphate 3-epimerase [Mycoplasmopsis mustelae]|uniref:Ribulose-phosphate 3-epimerase n=1 Tax=Mycoplasmopsis mustelae TaxID=171289 RepID=A0A4R7UBR0_9BACT|nr:ribulose-phosphate 3-epimerase [Mycoplasmopsis mustelae]TDV22700.1 ribulose-phosphate 3-epimerase [Mycoplasmopsis mustelae]
MKRYVTPSLLNVEKDKRLSLANTLVQNGIKWIHYDVMDAKFVANTAIEINEIININQNGLSHIKDVHLMVENPYGYIDKLKNDVDIITFHYEAIENDLDKFQNFLEKNHHDLKIGLALKPNTSVDKIINFLHRLTLVLVMSVEPGKGGQKFIDNSLDKIKKLKLLRQRDCLDFLIQVDGGINDITGPKCFKAGADACVAGTFLVFEPTKERINSILNEIKK